MFLRVAITLAFLATFAGFAASKQDHAPTLLGFVKELARAEPLNPAKLRALLPTELVQTYAKDAINRVDYIARDIPLSDGRVSLVDFRQVGANSITVVEVSDGCLRINEVERLFTLDDSITPNRTHFSDGVYRRSRTPWGFLSFELIEPSECVRSVVLNSGL